MTWILISKYHWSKLEFTYPLLLQATVKSCVQKLETASKRGKAYSEGRIMVFYTRQPTSIGIKDCSLMQNDIVP